MGLFSKKKHTPSAPPPPPPPPPKPGPVTSEQLREAKAFMADWSRIIEENNDASFWGALARFGRIGDAVQTPENTQSANMRMLGIAREKFNNDFAAMFDWPWRNWIAYAKAARDTGDNELAAQLFLFAWAMKQGVTFNSYAMIVGFEKPRPDTFKAIAAEAHAAATAAPPDFAVVERRSEKPVTRELILFGTSDVLGIAPPS